MTSSPVVITTAEVTAQTAARRTVMRIDCRKLDSRIGQRIQLKPYSLQAPDPPSRPCPNNPSHQLRNCRRSWMASAPSALSPKSKITRGFVQSGFDEVALTLV